MEEIWRPCVGFPGYSASNLASIRRDAKELGTGLLRFRGERILQVVTRKGAKYRYVTLWVDGKRNHVAVRELVARAFLDPVDGWILASKDGDCHNERADNLEYREPSPSQRKGLSEFAKHWRKYLAEFTTEQRTEWLEIIRDRIHDTVVCSEAVEMIMLDAQRPMPPEPPAAAANNIVSDFHWRRRGTRLEMVRDRDRFVVDRVAIIQTVGIR